MRRHQLRRVMRVLGDARARLCWLVLLWLGLSGVASAQAPWEARAGVLDVRTWDTREMIAVLGEWQFAYLDLREPQTNEARAWQTRIGAWQGGFPGTPYGYGTYRLLVQLPRAGLYGLRLAEADGTLSCVDTLELGFPLALEEDIRPFLAQMTLLLEPGAGVAVFSDGITEAPNPQGALYGLSRLADVISQHWHAPAKTVCNTVLADVYAFINDTTDVPANVAQSLHDQNVEDDITLLIIKQLHHAEC